MASGQVVDDAFYFSSDDIMISSVDGESIEFMGDGETLGETDNRVRITMRKGALPVIHGECII